MGSQVKIENDTLVYHHMTKKIFVIFLLTMLISIGLATSFVMPLVDGRYPDMPRSFFFGMCVSGFVLGFVTLKLFFNYRTITTIDAQSKSIPLYAGIEKEEADKILDFCKQHSIATRDGKQTVNKAVVFGTILFVAALLAELSITGKLNLVF